MRKKVVCGSFFCILFMVQGLAEIEIGGTLTGKVTIGADADFSVSGSIQLDLGSKRHTVYTIEAELSSGYG